VRIGIVGATGIVGRELVTLLATSKLEITELRLSATSRSKGKSMATHLGERRITEVNPGFFSGLDMCFFCVSPAVSEKWVPVALANDVVSIDNSSRYRLEKDVPLVVPEVNGDLLGKGERIIANPNCIVTPLVAAIYPIKKHFGLEELILSTYQSVSGAGQEALNQLEEELGSYPRRPREGKFLLNVLGAIGSIDESGHCQEEMKIVRETRKILNMPELPVAVTAARVAVKRGHCQAVTFITGMYADPREIAEVLQAEGIVVTAAPPQPLILGGSDKVYVGRLRENREHRPRSYSLWLGADNLRKGAALNALEIAEEWWFRH